MGEDFVPKVFSLILSGSTLDLFAYVPYPSLFLWYEFWELHALLTTPSLNLPASGWNMR
jgi:hypothetical protein